jgi:hypothetical protein
MFYLVIIATRSNKLVTSFAITNTSNIVSGFASTSICAYTFCPIFS